jgi:hypothetical protein
VVLLLAGVARAEQPVATFALIIGVNRSVDPELKPLQYADDDAARWQELFRTLGARTWLMARLDENTARLHPQAAAEAVEPLDAKLNPLVAEVASALEHARAKKVPTVLYVVYAGHGNVRDGQGSLALEDVRLTAADLSSRLFEKLPAARAHLIADACYSSFLASARGPGGARRTVEGFSSGARLAKVGLLLSTSSARESHEWEGFQAGVFSHELRSGLHGAADADGDGRVSYREIAAFVQRANAAIVNDKYRPDVFAQPAEGGDELVDLREALGGRRLEVDGAHGAHYLLEDTRGVRLADFHNASSQTVKLLRPSAGGALYLRNVNDEKEYVLPPGPALLAVATLRPERPRVNSRGAANDAFASTFSVPFDSVAVETWKPKTLLELEGRPPSAVRPLGFASLGVGAASLLAGGVLTAVGASARGGVGLLTSQQDANAVNRMLATTNVLSIVLYVAGAVLAGAGITMVAF